MKRYQITLGEQTFDVKVLSDPRQRTVQVEVDGQPLTVEISAIVAAAEAPTAGAAPSTVPSPAGAPVPAPTAISAATSNTVTTPLPGVIKTIAVRPGQKVSVNDELVVIEAMKMDNVIRAQRAGTIGTVFVTEGRQVAHGEPLLDYAE
jgi:propionyl-CoA carboxylase alpha chain